MKGNLIVQISEGLGNQLFMYAHAYALSKKLNKNLLIDDTTGYFKNKNSLRPHQKYMLNYFNISEDCAPDYFKYDTFSRNIYKKILIFFDNFKSNKKFLIEFSKKTNNKKVVNNYSVEKLCLLYHSDLFFRFYFRFFRFFRFFLASERISVFLRRQPEF